MSILGSVKNRLKTQFIINKKRKKINKNAEKQKKDLEEKNKTEKKFKQIKLILNVDQDKKKISSSLNKGTVKNINFVKFNENTVLRKIKAGRLKVNLNIKKESNILKHDNIKSSNIDSLEEETQKKENNVSLIKDDIEKEDKLVTNIKDRFSSFIKDSKKEIKKLKEDLSRKEKELEKTKTKQEADKIKEQILLLKQRIDELKLLYDSILEKYEFYDYDNLNDNLLYKYIDDFKFFYSNNDIDLLVNECKDKIDYIEEVNELVLKVDNLVMKEENKNDRITSLSNDYYNRLEDFNKLNNNSYKIERYIEKEEEYLKKVEKEIENNEINTSISYHLKFNKKYIDNLFRLNVGLSLFDKTYIGAFIGAFLIKKSLSPLLLKAFTKEKITTYTYKYNEYIKKINDNLDIIKETKFLLKTSIEDVSKLKNYMKEEYKEYLDAKMYKDLFNKIETLEKSLNKKYDKTIKLEEKINKQKEKNREKQKKLELMYKKN